MDANKDGTIDLEEWEKYMTPELKAAIQKGKKLGTLLPFDNAVPNISQSLKGRCELLAS